MSAWRMHSCGLPAKQTGSFDRNSQDSAIGSHHVLSQAQDSQHSLFSQVATQDVFSHGSSEPYSENTLPGNKKSGLFEKYWSKRSLFKQDATPLTTENRSRVLSAPGNLCVSLCTPRPHGTKIMMNRPTVDCAHLSLKKSENKMGIGGQEERYLLEHMANTFQECSGEVKSVVFSLKEKMEHLAEASNEQLVHMVTSFLQDIWKHQERLEQCIQDQGKSRCSYAELQVKLDVKESELVKLQEQLAEAKGETATVLAKAVRSEMQASQEGMQQTLELILGLINDTKENQNVLTAGFNQELKAHEKQLSNLTKAVQNNIREVEKRFVTELKKMQNKLESGQENSTVQLKKSVNSYLESHVVQMENVFEQLIQQSENQSLVSYDKADQQRKAELLNLFRSHIDGLNEKLKTVIGNDVGRKIQELTYKHNTLAESFSQVRNLLQVNIPQCIKTSEFLEQVESRLFNFQTSLKSQFAEVCKTCLEEVKKINILNDGQCSERIRTSERHEKNTSGIFSRCPEDREEKRMVLPDRSVAAFQLDAQKSINTKRSKPILSESNEISTTGNTVVSQTAREILPRIFQTQIASNARFSENRATKSQYLLSGRKNFGNMAGVNSATARFGTSFVSRTGPSPVAAVRPQRLQNDTCSTFQETHADSQQEPAAICKTIDSCKGKKKSKKKCLYSKAKKSSQKRFSTSQKVRSPVSTQTKYSVNTQQASRAYLEEMRECEFLGKQSKLDSQFICNGDPRGMLSNACQDNWKVTDHTTRSKRQKLSDTEMKRLSVYDFHEDEYGISEFLQRSSKGRFEMKSDTGCMSLASFLISNRATEQVDKEAADESSDCSSSCVSVTGMAIKRKIKTPFRKSIHAGEDFCTQICSPANTLLSNISSRV